MTWTRPSIENRPIAILGAGVLGRRIACVFVNAGYDVNIRDPFEQARNDAIAYIDENKEEYSTIIKKTNSSRTFGSYSAFSDIDSAVRNAWLVIEAVPEKLQLKIDTMEELDQKAPEDCIIGSNSSSFKSSLMLDKVSPNRRKQIFNMHFFMPPAILIVELMTDGETEPSVFTLMEEVLREVGMSPFTAKKESTGFIFNRLWAAIKREIMFMLSEGVADPTQIDAIWKMLFNDRSLPPCQFMDQIGLDTVAFIEDNYVQERKLDGSMTVDFLREEYTNQGRLGLKSDKGGLYPPTTTSETSNAQSLYFLDVGLGQNLKDLSKMDENGKIMRRGPDGKVTTLVKGLPLPDGIDISHSAGRMFWTNMGHSLSTEDGSVMSAKLDGSDVRVILPEGSVHTPKQLVVEEKSQMLYFCDREGTGVHRCSFDGSKHEVLVKTGDGHRVDLKDAAQWCVGITVDPIAGKVYWTQKGPCKAGQGRIFRANIDIPNGETAENRTDIELIADSLPEPIDLELDVEGQVLYCTDRGDHPVGSSLYRMSVKEKNARPEIVARHFHEPIGLKLDLQNQVAYVSDLGGSLYRVQLDGGNKEVLHRDGGSYTGITLG